MVSDRRCWAKTRGKSAVFGGNCIYSDILWIGRAGISQLALSAIDIAVWDLKAKAAEMPLWKLLGGSETCRLEAYNTDGGWLNWSKTQLVDDATRLVAEGFRGVKIKIGSPDPNDDLERIKAVRHAIGPRVQLMVDANGRWDLPTAVQIGRHLADYAIRWFEEPMWFDDVAGHAVLAGHFYAHCAGRAAVLVGRFSTVHCGRGGPLCTTRRYADRRRHAVVAGRRSGILRIACRWSHTSAT